MEATRKKQRTSPYESSPAQKFQLSNTALIYETATSCIYDCFILSGNVTTSFSMWCFCPDYMYSLCFSGLFSHSGPVSDATLSYSRHVCF